METVDSMLKAVPLGLLIRSIFAGGFFVISFYVATTDASKLKLIEGTSLFNLALPVSLFAGMLIYGLQRAWMYPLFEYFFESKAGDKAVKWTISERSIKTGIWRWNLNHENPIDNRAFNEKLNTWADIIHTQYSVVLSIAFGSLAGIAFDYQSKHGFSWPLFLTAMLFLLSGLFNNARHYAFINYFKATDNFKDKIKSDNISMNHYLDINWMAKRDCWVSYFDLLGFGAKVKDSGFGLIVNDYSQCLDEAARQCSRANGVEYAWFSDTFIFYTQDRTDSSFKEIERVSRFFIQILTQKRFPMRGALSGGEFFADKGKQVFVGPALVDAHCWGEKYNWIGFVLSYDAVQGPKYKGLTRQHYREGSIEYKKPLGFDKENALALMMIEANGKSTYLDALRAMMGNVSNEHKRKYQNSISFLEGH